MTYKESLKLLRDTIANHENAFSIGEAKWRHDTIAPEDSHVGECGTPACIIAWSDHLFHTNPGFRKSAFSSEVFVPSESDPTTDGNSYNRNPEWFTRARTVAMLDQYIETGEVNWQALEKKGVIYHGY